jgi:hypothetical protein
MVGGSLWVLRLLPPGRHDIAEILLKVALNTKNQSINQSILQRIIWLYKRFQLLYDEIRKTVPPRIEFVQGIPTDLDKYPSVRNPGVPRENHRPWASNW